MLYPVSVSLELVSIAGSSHVYKTRHLAPSQIVNQAIFPVFILRHCYCLLVSQRGLTRYQPLPHTLFFMTLSSLRCSMYTQPLIAEAAAAWRSANTITTGQINQILQREKNRRWPEFHNSMLVQGQQKADNIVHHEAAQTLIDMRRAATTTATTTRAQARSETTIQFLIPKPKRLHSIEIANNEPYNRPLLRHTFCNLC